MRFINTWDKVQAIHDLIKQTGTLIPKSIPSGADAWQAGEVKSIMTDGGYGLQIVAPQVTVWAQYGSDMHGFMAGNVDDLNNLLAQMGMPAQ
jgi:hypothetical protein